MKKWLSMLLTVSLVLMLGASCGTNSYYKDEDEEYSDEEYVEEDFEKSSADSGIEGLRTEVSQDRMFYLIKDGELYSLGAKLYEAEGVDYSSVGITINPGERQIYGVKRVETSTGESGISSKGAVPLPVLETEDMVVAFSNTAVPTLGLHKMNFYGYALDIEDFANKTQVIVTDYETGEVYYVKDLSNFSVTDSNGNEVEDYHNLPQGESCTVSWFEGTQYEEHNLKANNRFYGDNYSLTERSLGKKLEPDYEIEGELTKEGYATYDFSGIPAGIYCLLYSETEGENSHGGMIEIR